MNPLSDDLLLDSILKGLSYKYKVAVDPSIQTTIDLLETKLTYLEGVFAEEVPRRNQSLQLQNFPRQDPPFQNTYSSVRFQDQPAIQNHDRRHGLNPNSAEFQPGRASFYNTNSRPFCEFCRKAGHNEQSCYRKNSVRTQARGSGNARPSTR